MKKFKIKTKKYKNIFLILLLIFAFTLDSYSDHVRKIENEQEENKLGYFLSDGKYEAKDGYIYVGDDNDIEILSNVTVTSANGKIEEGYLRFYQWNSVLVEFTLVRISFGNLLVEDKDIIISDNISYEEFISNLTLTNAIVKIYKGIEEVTEGNIESGMLLKIFYNDELVDSYSITDNYLDISKLNIKDNKYVISNISTVLDIKNKINTSGSISVLDSDGNILTDDKNITTNSKIKIELSNKTYEYTIVVLGDVTGSGDIFIGDISKLYQYYKGLIEMDECYVIAGDVTYDGIIDISDVAKLYQYHKEIISSL